jgi:hypothetical protein
MVGTIRAKPDIDGVLVAVHRDNVETMAPLVG